MGRVPKTQYAKSGDLSIAYQIHGSGPIDLVLAGGWFGHLEVMWEHPVAESFLRRLGSFARVIRFDRRGTGLSSRGVEPSPVEERVDDLRAVMAAAGAERAALYGWNDGGVVSAIFAAVHPEKCQALVLSNVVARARKAPDYVWGEDDDSWEAGVEYMKATWGAGTVIERVAPSMVEDEGFREWFGKYQRYAVSVGDFERHMEASSAIDIRAVLPAIQAPTLYLHRGMGQPEEEAQWIARRIPNATYVGLSGRDTFPVVDHDAVLDEVERFLVGTSTGRTPDRALATLLFTDIVGSTDRAASEGDRRWVELLEQHHERVRRQIRDHRGREVNTAGDGFVATFDGPARGVACAKSIVAAVRELGLDIRAGLHTGEVERHGDDVAGMAVHIAARVASLARTGEILVSRTVRDLVVGSDLEFDDRGTHALKGVPEEWQLFAVR